MTDALSREADGCQVAADIIMIRNRRMIERYLKMAVGALFILEGAFGLGLSEKDAVHPDAIILLIGVVVLVDGVWSAIRLTPGAMLMTAFTFVTVGVWFIAHDDGGISINLLTLFGALLIGLGYWHVRKYAEFRAVYARRPEETVMNRMSGLIHRFQKGEQRIAIRFKIRVIGGETLWQGDLSGPIAFLYHPMTGKLVCASSRQFGIGEPDAGGISPVRMRSRTFAGLVDAETRQRYLEWASGVGRE